MKLRDKIALTHIRIREAVTYDPETGKFWPLVPRHAVQRDRELGHVDKSGYRSIMIDRVKVLAHRLAWFYMTGENPDRYVDHRNLDRADNRWSNLRLATAGQNQANRRGNGPSGLKGASWNRFRGHWQSYIKIDGKSHSLGRFETAEAAHAAYVAAAHKHFGEFARAG